MDPSCQYDGEDNGGEGQRCAQAVGQRGDDYTSEELEFIHEFRMWSRQLDKLLVMGEASGFTQLATYRKESAWLQEMQHQMKQARAWST